MSIELIYKIYMMRNPSHAFVLEIWEAEFLFTQGLQLAIPTRNIALPFDVLVFVSSMLHLDEKVCTNGFLFYYFAIYYQM